MLSFSDSFEETLRFPAGHEGFVVLRERGRAPGHPMHRHAELEFNLVVRGTARYLLGDRRYELRPQHLVWLFPAQDHVLLDRSLDYAHWILVARPEFVAHLCRTTPGNPLTEPNPPGYFCRRLHDTDALRLETLLTQVRDTPLDEADWFNAGLGYILQSAWAAYRRANDAESGEALIHPAVERAVFLLRSLDVVSDQTLTIAEIAARCEMSPAHLARLFRAQIGWGMVAFRNRERIRLFLDVYGRGQRTTVLNAALEVGFGSYAQFHRIFKDAMNCSPAQYRRQQFPDLRKTDDAGSETPGKGEAAALASPVPGPLSPARFPD